MRGFNLSSKPKEVQAYGRRPVLSDVTAILDHFGGKGCKAILAGHDWGGAVAWRYAQEHPERLLGLVALNMPELSSFYRALTTDRAQMQRSWYMYAFQQADIPEALLQCDDWAWVREGIRNEDGAKRQSEDFVQMHVDALSRPGALTAGINYYRNLLHNWGMEAPRKIEIPVLLLWGDKEKYFEPGLSEPPRELVPNIRVEHFPEASHWVLWDESEGVLKSILDFAKDISAKF